MKKKDKNIVRGVTLLAALVFAGVIAGWQWYAPGLHLAIQAPGADHRPAGTARKTTDVRIGEFFMQYADTSSSLKGSWPCFRGAAHDDIAKAALPLNLGATPYPVLWKVTTGEGHAAPIVYQGRVYMLDYDETLSSDMLRCFALETGKELWRRWYRVPMKRNHGFSRTAPAIADGRICTIGPEGHLMCCELKTGKMLWAVDMQKRFQTTVPFWYTGQCPLIDKDVLVAAPAGKDTLLVGFDTATGKVLWATPNTPHFKMSHSSVMPMTLSGKRTYVYAAIGGVCGVSAEGPDRGKLLWTATRWQPNVLAPSPLQIASDRIFLVAGYGTGGALLKVERSGSGWKADIVDQYKPNEGLSSEQQTPIFYKGHIISIMPKDGGMLRDKLVLFSPNDLHKALWSSGADERFGLGPYLVINDYVFALKDDGELYVYQTKGEAMQLLKKQRILDGTDAWGPMAYADGRLLLRDSHNLVCIKISK
jgi:outer membrane protein assembly factor BamB